MKKYFIAASLLMGFVSLSASSFAQTRTPHIRARQERQQGRIAQGVKSGELTARETAHLEMREAKIQHDKKEAKADGVVTAQERRKLNREENRASRAIYRQKHDAQSRN